MIDYRPVQTDDIGKLCRTMREPDTVEVLAHHNRLHDGLAHSVDISYEVFTTTEFGEPISLSGIAFYTIRGMTVGIPWLLGSDRVYRHPRLLIRQGIRYLAHHEQTADVMHQFVWEENHASRQYLEYLQFHPTGLKIDRNNTRLIQYQRGGLCVASLQG